VLASVGQAAANTHAQDFTRQWPTLLAAADATVGVLVGCVCTLPWAASIRAFKSASKIKAALAVNRCHEEGHQSPCAIRRPRQFVPSKQGCGELYQRPQPIGTTLEGAPMPPTYPDLAVHIPDCHKAGSRLHGAHLAPWPTAIANVHVADKQAIRPCTHGLYGQVQSGAYRAEMGGGKARSAPEQP